MAVSGSPVGARPAILLLLVERPQHGYELRDQVANLMGTTFNAAGLYRTLRSMEEESLVTSSWSPGDRGPRRRRYSVTAAGVDALDVYATELKDSARVVRAFLRRYSDIPRPQPQR